MEVLLKIFGEGKDLNASQMGCRALVVFVFALVLIRIAGRRSFGLKRSLDNIIVILLGSVLSRAIVGASPFVATIAACLVLVVLHRLCAWAGIHNRLFSKWINGDKIAVYKNGHFLRENMNKALVHKEDVLEEVRLRALTETLDKIDTVYMEKSGELSAVKKD